MNKIYIYIVRLFTFSFFFVHIYMRTIKLNKVEKIYILIRIKYKFGYILRYTYITYP